MIQDKAQSAENGYSLFKGCNAVLAHLDRSLRVCREVIVLGAAPLHMDAPLSARRALWPTASRLAEPVNITLKEYQPAFTSLAP